MTAPREIPFGRPWITDEDRQAVLEVLQGHILTHGPETRGFEEDFAAYLGEDCYCVAVSSCTAALHLAYFQMGLGAGDEVIVPAQTHNATAHAVELMGARPVFVDCEPETGNIDCELVERAITSKTKAIMPIHLYGQMCDMRRLREIADDRDLLLVEDCAHCIEGERAGVKPGQLGDAAVFSFYATKNIGCGEGGAIITNLEWLRDALLKHRLHGLSD